MTDTDQKITMDPGSSIEFGGIKIATKDGAFLRITSDELHVFGELCITWTMPGMNTHLADQIKAYITSACKAEPTNLLEFKNKRREKLIDNQGEKS